MIDSGVKKVEFREATPYWDVRVANWIRRWKRATCDEPGKIPVLEFQNGYGRFSPRMAFIAGGDVYDVLDAKTPVQHKELGEFPKKRYVFFIGERVRLSDGADRARRRGGGSVCRQVQLAHDGLLARGRDADRLRHLQMKGQGHGKRIHQMQGVRQGVHSV
jgi:hypothetical protein